MGRTFQDDLRDDVSRTFLAEDHFGEPVVYHSITAGTVSTSAIKTEDTGGPTDMAHNRPNVRTAVFSLPESDIPWPVDGETLVYVENGVETVWDFKRIKKRDIGMWHLEMSTGKPGRTGFAKPNSM